MVSVCGWSGQRLQIGALATQSSHHWSALITRSDQSLTSPLASRSCEVILFESDLVRPPFADAFTQHNPLLPPSTGHRKARTDQGGQLVTDAAVGQGFAL